MAMYDNVQFQAELPGPAPEPRWFLTEDLSDQPDHASRYLVTPGGELHLIAHELIAIRERMSAAGLLWQYPSTLDIRPGLQVGFSGVVELWSEVATYDAEFRNGILVAVTLRPMEDGN